MLYTMVQSSPYSINNWHVIGCFRKSPLARMAVPI